jgi:hypothetical protein
VARSSTQVTQKHGVQEKDAVYASMAEDMAADESVPEALRRMTDDPRITVRRGYIQQMRALSS